MPFLQPLVISLHASSNATQRCGARELQLWIRLVPIRGTIGFINFVRASFDLGQEMFGIECCDTTGA